MLNSKWSKKYNKCIVCESTERKHYGKGMCRECYIKKWRENNSEKTKEQGKEWYKKNTKKKKKYGKKYYIKNLIKIKKHSKAYKKENSEKIKNYNKKYYKDNSRKINTRIKKQYLKYPEEFKERCRRYYKKNSKECNEKSKKRQRENPEKYQEYQKKYRKENHEKIRKYHRIYEYNKKHKNSCYKLKCNISRTIYTCLKKKLLSKDKQSTFDFLPYTVNELKQHLEKQFESWMNWNNWGVGKGHWNIDHIVPKSNFNYSNVKDKEFQECWALSNLKPLDAIENIKKSNKII